MHPAVHPTVRATWDLGSRQRSAYQLIPESCGARAQWNFTDQMVNPMLGFQSRSEHALSSSPLAYISLGHHWPVVGQEKLERSIIIKECFGQYQDQRHSLSSLPCVDKIKPRILSVGSLFISRFMVFNHSRSFKDSSVDMSPLHG